MGSPCCAVGGRPDAAAIDAALRAGQGLGTVAKRFPLLAKSSLGVHRARCLGMAVQGASSTPSSPASTAIDAGGAYDGNITQSQEKESIGGPLVAVQKVARVRGDAEPVAAPRPGGVQAAVQTSSPASASEAEHVQAIADQMADGLWVGRRSVREYANAHGLRRGQVKDYAKAAALVCYADEKEIEQRRQPALGRWLKLYEEAMALPEPDLKAAASALTGYDRAAGIIKPAGPAVSVNVLQAPPVLEFAGATAAFLAALCPEHAEVVDAWLEAVDKDTDGARSDPAGWLERRRRTITVGG